MNIRYGLGLVGLLALLYLGTAVIRGYNLSANAKTQCQAVANVVLDKLSVEDRDGRLNVFGSSELDTPTRRAFLQEFDAKYGRVNSIESAVVKLSTEKRDAGNGHETLAYCAVKFVAERQRATLGLILVQRDEATWGLTHLAASD